MATSEGQTTQWCLDRVQEWRSILSQFGSSNEPPAMARKPGSASAVHVTVVPQFGQNCVFNQRSDSSERYSYVFSAPPSSTSVSLKYAPMPNALPVRRWQLRQWHTAVRTG